MAKFARSGQYDVLLEAEVAPKSQARFEKRYKAATNQAASPGNSKHYQSQSGKWGAELRVYFNDPGMAASLEALGFHVEFPRKGCNSGKYKYRVNDNNLWWKLVELEDMRLGPN